MTRRFEFVEGTSTKFREIRVNGAEGVTRWSRLGTDGQTQKKAFPDAATATKQAEEQVCEKLAKGYSEAEAVRQARRSCERLNNWRKLVAKRWLIQR